MNTHPDYMNYGKGKMGNEEYPAKYYIEFLKYIREKYSGQYWHPLPREIARYWRDIYKMDWLQWQAYVYPYYNHNHLRSRKTKIFEPELGGMK